jgi:hypothetical protein
MLLNGFFAGVTALSEILIARLPRNIVSKIDHSRRPVQALDQGQGRKQSVHASATASGLECTAEHEGQARQEATVIATTGTASIRRNRLQSGKPFGLGYGYCELDERTRGSTNGRLTSASGHRFAILIIPSRECRLPGLANSDSQRSW